MNEASAALLQVEHLHRSYERGSVLALSDVSFSANSGEVVALTGPSGCGKSTLLSLISLLDRPDAGRVLFRGADISTMRKPHLFRARHVGFVFQFHHMIPSMTLRENIEAPMLALDIPKSTRLPRSQELLAQMGLEHRADFLPAKVSGGERQRAAVARALVNRPELVLADEPTGNLDSHNSARVVELLTEHAHSQGALVLIATHNPDIAAQADRHITLCDGRVIHTTP